MVPALLIIDVQNGVLDHSAAPELQAAKVDHLIIGGNSTQFCIDTTCRRAVSLGYEVSLLADCHMTGDAGDLRFDQIIAHHNSTLNGFAAGQHRITVIESPGILASQVPLDK